MNNNENKPEKNIDDDVAGMVETLHATSLPSPNNKNRFMARISPKPGSVGAIIRSYKSAVTRHARLLGFEFEWQERFHDHIIRNDNEYRRIAEYIIHNPEKWNDNFSSWKPYEKRRYYLL